MKTGRCRPCCSTAAIGTTTGRSLATAATSGQLNSCSTARHRFSLEISGSTITDLCVVQALANYPRGASWDHRGTGDARASRDSATKCEAAGRRAARHCIDRTPARFSSRTCSSLPPTISRVRRGHLRQRVAGQVGPAAARHDRADRVGRLRRGRKCGPRRRCSPRSTPAQAVPSQAGPPARGPRLAAGRPGARCQRHWRGRRPRPLPEDRPAAFPGPPACKTCATY